MMITNRIPPKVALAPVLHLVLLFGFKTVVEAQTAEPNPVSGVSATGVAATGSSELQQVVVTGYLIPRIGQGPQPVTTYDQHYIQDTGYQTVTDVLQNLPGATGNFNPAVTSGFSFSPASASIALKGLPPNDTLVLVDGLRMPSYPFPQNSTAGAFNFVDINSVPVAAIDRIEILNDGGSATYGTDAVAGVVNLVLKDQYQGADINNYFGISQRGDYQVYHGQFVAQAGTFSPDNGIAGNIHTIGSWSTFDWQISYKFGKPSEVTPEAPKPGYNKEGKKLAGEKAIAPAPEGARAGLLRTLLANITLTFGINNIFDTRPPLSVDNVITNFDPASGASYIQRFFWFSVDKKF